MVAHSAIVRCNSHAYCNMHINVHLDIYMYKFKLILLHVYTCKFKYVHTYLCVMVMYTGRCASMLPNVRQFRSHVLIGRAFYTRTGSSESCIFQRIYKYTLAHIRMYIYMHAYAFICVSWIGMYVHLHQYLHVYMYIYIYLHDNGNLCTVATPHLHNDLNVN